MLILHFLRVELNIYDVRTRKLDHHIMQKLKQKDTMTHFWEDKQELSQQFTFLSSQNDISIWN